MAKDTRRSPGSGLRKECNRRGCLRLRAIVAYVCAPAFRSNEISFEKQDASFEGTTEAATEVTIKVTTEEVIRAGHFSHSGCFARIYHGTK